NQGSRGCTGKNRRQPGGSAGDKILANLIGLPVDHSRACLRGQFPGRQSEFLKIPVQVAFAVSNRLQSPSRQIQSQELRGGVQSAGGRVPAFHLVGSDEIQIVLELRSGNRLEISILARRCSRRRSRR